MRMTAGGADFARGVIVRVVVTGVDMRSGMGVSGGPGMVMRMIVMRVTVAMMVVIVLVMAGVIMVVMRRVSVAV